jgi:uncharacterized protein YecA (UPF0149 family)
MGAFADAMSRFAQPLIDASDGSPEDLQRAYTLSQLCWNLALLPEENRAEFLAKMQPALKMDDEEFQELKRGVVVPMIQRHQEMFPAMRHRTPMPAAQSATARPIPPPAPRIRIAKKYPGTGRNEPCPCGSGRKYKVCCGR